MSWKKVLWPASAVPFLGLLAYGLTRDPNTIESPLPGTAAAAFELETLDGESLRLSDLRGKVVVLNFWASWCLACEAEHPYLVEAQREYANNDVQLIGIVYQDSRANAIRYTRRMGGTWPNLMDSGSRVAIEYGVYGVPETFFIDRDGVIAFKQIGPVNRNILGAWIPKLLALPPGASTALTDSVPRLGRSEGYERRPPK